MLELTKLNGQCFLLSVSLIEQVESLPDTTITLVNGKKLFVKESRKEVMDLSNAFYRRIGLIGLTSKGESGRNDSK